MRSLVVCRPWLVAALSGALLLSPRAAAQPPDPPAPEPPSLPPPPPPVDPALARWMEQRIAAEVEARITAREAKRAAEEKKA